MTTTAAKLKPLSVLPAFTVIVNGDELLVDSRTFTMKEHRLRRRELTRISVEDDLVPDDADIVATSIWIVLRRSDPDLAFDDVLDSLNFGAMVDRQPAGDDVRSDDPEA
jgi:hypothetical protein